MEEEIFPHECITPSCEKIVQFDDEPWCFEHSPDEGSSLAGYSARRAAEGKKVREVRHNVFEQTAE